MTRSSGDGTRDLAVNGHVNVDVFLRVDRFPEADRTVPLVGGRTELGGTATIIALVASREKARVGLLSRIGDGFPAEFRHRLERSGIDLGGLQRVPGRLDADLLHRGGPRGGAADVDRPGADG